MIQVDPGDDRHVQRFTVKQWLEEYSEWASAMMKSFEMRIESAFLRRFVSFRYVTACNLHEY